LMSRRTKSVSAPLAQMVKCPSGIRGLIARKQAVIATKIAEMQAELAVETDELSLAIAQQKAAASTLVTGRDLLARDRERVNGVSLLRAHEVAR